MKLLIGSLAYLLCCSLISGRLLIDWEAIPTVFDNNYEEIPFKETTANLTWKQLPIQIGHPPRTVVGHVAVLPNPRSLRFVLPESHCGLRQKLSVTASNQACLYGTNAGFFNMDTGACVGNLISNSQTVQLPAFLRVNFGILKDRFLVGYVNSSWLRANRDQLQQLISGACWLVRAGQSVVNKSAATERIEGVFVNEKAPRTGVGIRATGEAVLLQIDGVESEKKGVDLHEFSEAFQYIGVTQAVNLDGGGSSESWARGHGVISQPTCTDTPAICERAVSSISCIVE